MLVDGTTAINQTPPGSFQGEVRDSPYVVHRSVVRREKVQNQDVDDTDRCLLDSRSVMMSILPGIVHIRGQVEQSHKEMLSKQLPLVASSPRDVRMVGFCKLLPWSPMKTQLN